MRTCLEVKDRKSKGTYYTPREIVHYMCQESLINYLDTAVNTGEVALAKVKPVNLKLFGAPAVQQQAFKAEGDTNRVPREDIEALVRMGDLAIEHDTYVESQGKETRVYSYKLPQSIRFNAELIDEALAKIRVCDPAIGSGTFLVGVMMEIVRARNTLTTYLPTDATRTNYHFKRHAIQTCLYGVDIDPGAVEIAKLRLWLSLVVDEDDIKQIQPLPNLDYKIVCGNSLMVVERRIENWPLFAELERLKPLHFEETNAKKKQEYKQQIDQLIMQLTDNKKTFDFEIYFSEIFHKKSGFDIVIGNPPYVQLQKDSGKLADLYENRGYKVFERTGDIYALFYERGINILRNLGYLCFITSNKWMRASYGESLRSYFLTKNACLLIDLGPGIFENATVDTNILIVQNEANKNCLHGLTLTTEAKDKDLAEYVNQNAIRLPQMAQKAWFIGNTAQQKLKEKIELTGKPLKDWDISINYGIKTGLNEVFIIDTPTKKRLCQEDLKSTEIVKPILRGRDINRYAYEWAGLWLIASGYDINVPMLYPAIYKYLKQHEEKSRNRDDQGQNWWNLRACAYYPEFEKEKIVWPRLTRIHKSEDRSFPRFAIAKKNTFVLDSLCFITGDKSKYILAILNSCYASDYFHKNIAILDNGGMQMRQQYVENLLIPPITTQNQPIVNIIEALVEQIITAKKQNTEANTGTLEAQIDQLVYQLYELTRMRLRWWRERYD